MEKWIARMRRETEEKEKRVRKTDRNNNGTDSGAYDEGYKTNMQLGTECYSTSERRWFGERRRQQKTETEGGYRKHRKRLREDGVKETRRTEGDRLRDGRR